MRIYVFSGADNDVQILLALGLGEIPVPSLPMSVSYRISPLYQHSHEYHINPRAGSELPPETYDYIDLIDLKSTSTYAKKISKWADQSPPSYLLFTFTQIPPLPFPQKRSWAIIYGTIKRIQGILIRESHPLGSYSSLPSIRNPSPMPTNPTSHNPDQIEGEYSHCTTHSSLCFSLCSKIHSNSFKRLLPRCLPSSALLTAASVPG
ncbi:hypothetical protein BDW66DRAFT_97297 [Aspergillus desertorum]